eukprot:scaffold119821_cov27-Phaeocystis_antarctica.AAC.1
MVFLCPTGPPCLAARLCRARPPRPLQPCHASHPTARLVSRLVSRLVDRLVARLMARLVDRLVARLVARLMGRLTGRLAACELPAAWPLARGAAA